MSRPPLRHRAPTPLSLALLLAVLAPPARGQEYRPGPAGQWETRTPAEAGMDGVRLQEAIRYAVESETQALRDLAALHPLTWGREPFDEPIGPLQERGPMTGVVVRHGYIVAEWGEPHRVDMTFSVTKSFLSTVVGLAVQDGLIRDVHDRVREYVPVEHFESEHNRTITWDHLLRQTSDWEGTLWGKPDWADRPQGDPSGWLTRPRNPAGTVYKYNDVRVNVLALAALNVWRRPLPEVLRERIMDPIGASSTWRWHGYENSWVNMDGQWVQSVSGGGHWGGGMFISARDMARFGLLHLRNGRWGERQLISPEWIDQARTPTGAQPTYGFMNFFLNTGGEPLPHAPEDAYWFVGSGTNIVYVDARNDLVVVLRWIDRSRLDGIIERVLAAIQ